MHIATGLPEHAFIALLCHTARKDHRFLAHLENVIDEDHLLDVTCLLAPLASVLPAALCILDAPRGVCYFPFLPAGASLPSMIPALCRHGPGVWTSGLLTCGDRAHTGMDPDHVVPEPGASPEPAAHPDHEVMEPIDVVHHVPSFIGALGCVASVTFAQMLSAVCSVGLTECRVCSLHVLAALVAELVEAFPGGLFLRTTWPIQYWLLQGGVAQPSCLSSGCSTHIFVQRDALGHFSPMVHVPRQVGAYNFRFFRCLCRFLGHTATTAIS